MNENFKIMALRDMPFLFLKMGNVIEVRRFGDRFISGALTWDAESLQKEMVKKFWCVVADDFDVVQIDQPALIQTVDAT